MNQMKRHIFAGLTMLLFAALIIVSTMTGLAEEIYFWDAVIAVLAVYVMIYGVMKRSFFLFFFPIAVIGILFDTELGIEALTPVPILAIAALLSCGLRLIFPKRYVPATTKTASAETVSTSDSSIHIRTRFNSLVKYLDAKGVRDVHVDCSFSGNKLYFDRLVPEGAVLDVHMNLSFSGVDLFIPKTWRVEDLTNTTLSGVKNTEVPEHETDVTVRLFGNISFSGVDIRYV